MKKTVLNSMLALTLFASSVLAAGNDVHITVKGMVCAFCAQGITKKFKAEPAVGTVNVSLEKKSVDLSLKSGQTLSDDVIQKVLTDSGYTVEKIERN